MKTSFVNVKCALSFAHYYINKKLCHSYRKVAPTAAESRLLRVTQTNASSPDHRS
jgi:hypothetical protein